jgi:hypothetical protein
MDLLERYLQAVRFWLPQDQKTEVLADLEEDLRSQVEEREAALGRPLDEEETAALLRATGHPLKVAGQCLPEAPWLSPVLTLVYRLVLKVLLLWVLLPVFLLGALPGLLGAERPLEALPALAHHLAQAMLLSLGCITLVFLVAQRFQERLGLGSWDPRRLPPVVGGPGAARIPRGTSLAELAVNLLALGWWLDRARALPFAFSIQRGGITPLHSGLWAEFHQACYWPVVALLLLAAGQACFTVLHPTRVRLRSALRVLGDLGSVAIAGLFLRGHAMELRHLSFNLGHPGAGPWLDGVLLTCFLAVGVISGLRAVFGLYRLGITAEPAPARGSSR